MSQNWQQNAFSSKLYFWKAKLSAWHCGSWNRKIQDFNFPKLAMHFVWLLIQLEMFRFSNLLWQENICNSNNRSCRRWSFDKCAQICGKENVAESKYENTWSDYFVIRIIWSLQTSVVNSQNTMLSTYSFIQCTYCELW